MPQKIESEVHLLSGSHSGRELVAYLQERCWPLDRERVYLEGLAIGLEYRGFPEADPVVVRHPAALHVFRETIWGLHSALTDHLLVHPVHHVLCGEAYALATDGSVSLSRQG